MCILGPRVGMEGVYRAGAAVDGMMPKFSLRLYNKGASLQGTASVGNVHVMLSCKRVPS